MINFRLVDSMNMALVELPFTILVNLPGMSDLIILT